MTRKVFPTLLAMWLALALISVSAVLAETDPEDKVPRMTKDQLQGMLGTPGLVIVDVRIGWQSSGYKIKGAMREDPRNFLSWADKYPQDDTIVLYCA
jgi:hypothetical protein